MSTYPVRLATGTGRDRRRLTTDEAARGALPMPMTKDEWRAMFLASVQAEQRAHHRTRELRRQASMRGPAEPPPSPRSAWGARSLAIRQYVAAHPGCTIADLRVGVGAKRRQDVHGCVTRELRKGRLRADEEPFVAKGVPTFRLRLYPTPTTLADTPPVTPWVHPYATPISGRAA